MTENQQDPKTVTEEAGGYGTPTAEQEMPGGRREENSPSPARRRPSTPLG